MYEEKDFNFFVEHLTSNEVEDRGYAVRALRNKEKEGDERLLPLLEPLLEDKSFTITGGMPASYCEIRLLAAKAIENQRRLLGLPPRNISIVGFVYPGSYGKLSAFATKKTGIGMMERPSFESTEAELEYLREKGALPVFTSSQYPYIDYSTLPRSEDDEY